MRFLEKSAQKPAGFLLIKIDFKYNYFFILAIIALLK